MKSQPGNIMDQPIPEINVPVLRPAPPITTNQSTLLRVTA